MAKKEYCIPFNELQQAIGASPNIPHTRRQEQHWHKKFPFAVRGVALDVERGDFGLCDHSMCTEILSDTAMELLAQLVKAELEKWIRRKVEEHNASAKLDFEKFHEGDIEWDIGQIMGGFDLVRGFHGNDRDAQDALAKYGNGLYEGLYDWGKGWHIRVYLWMAGIEYAYAKLKEQAVTASPESAR